MRYIVVFLLCAAVALAERPRFQAELLLTVGESTGSQYRIAGTVNDRSVLGYIGTDAAPTSTWLFAEDTAGNIDPYRLDSVVSNSAVWLDGLWTYMPTGSPTNGPVVGTVAALCTMTPTNSLAIQPSLSGAAISEHLANGIRDYSMLAADSIQGGGTSDGGATNITAGASDSYDPATRTMTWNTNAAAAGTGTGTNTLAQVLTAGSIATNDMTLRGAYPKLTLGAAAGDADDISLVRNAAQELQIRSGAYGGGSASLTVAVEGAVSANLYMGTNGQTILMQSDGIFFAGGAAGQHLSLRGGDGSGGSGIDIHDNGLDLLTGGISNGAASFSSITLGGVQISAWPTTLALGLNDTNAYRGDYGVAASNLASSAMSAALGEGLARTNADLAIGLVASNALPIAGGTMAGAMTGTSLTVSSLAITGGATNGGVLTCTNGTTGQMGLLIPALKVKVASYTTQNTNTQPITITGIGFRPTAAHMFAVVYAGAYSDGWVDSATNYSGIKKLDDGSFYDTGAYLSYIQYAAGGQHRITLTSFDADGATFAQEKAVSPAVTNTIYLRMQFFR